MNEVKHTPGPWEVVDDCAISSRFHPTPSGRAMVSKQVCVASPLNFFNDDTPERRANARLIAAAPDLLAACRNVIDVGMSVRPDSVVWGEILAAIAKAEGNP